MEPLNPSLRHFEKGDFETDWIKVSECRFGQVYQAKLKMRGEKCAVKTFDTESWRQIINDVSAIANVKFKYLVSVCGVCSEANGVVMEHMSNGSLNNLLASHTLTWPKKFQMIHETSMGMNFLHNIKPPLLHLNLKTSNLLLDDHLHVKISDFSLIHWEKSVSKTSFMENLTARGNISYIPPETFSVSPDPPGTAFDVYSFGVVMWEILTQQKPYAGSSVTTVLVQVAQGKRPSLEILPENKPRECGPLISLMKLCWDQDQRKRPPFSDIVEKTEALSEVLMISGPVNNGGVNPWIVSSQIEKPDLPSDDLYGKETIISLLSKKDFGTFRKSVRREDVHRVFSEKKSLLHYTVASGDVESVKSVLSLGADVNCVTSKGCTPLSIAVVKSFHDIVSLLLDHGAAPTAADDDRWTSLHFAAQNGDDRTVRLLLDNGADAGAKEKAGWTPLHLACQNGHEAVVRLLLSRLSKVSAGLPEGQGRTPLHLATAYGHLNIVKLLITKGADPDAPDGSLSTALHLAAKEGHNRVVRHLVKCGANIDSANSSGYTPLHLAALKGHTGICRQLLTNKACPNSRTLQSWTPMHLAALKGHEAAVAELESQGGAVDARGEKGWTPLHLACHQSEPLVVLKLLAAGADPDVAEDSEGWTPLHVACTSASPPCVLHLISHDADVNALSSGKITPLHMAAKQGCASIVEALLLKGADTSAPDSSGASALTVAQSNEKWEIVQLLEKRC
ncbi:ankyrin repeat and protein kinase domain-containing protein 1 [Eucyclogobius newberryi]|uniref:ankyrin repeat and protein kinase domain-containing protein 1 n=1 Tax=Eucyclogobius newberryi TaxID=166745 RepID=UPI003B5C15EF